MSATASNAREKCPTCSGTGAVRGQVHTFGQGYNRVTCQTCGGGGTLSHDEFLVSWLRRASVAIYAATDAPVADDISPKLIAAADRLQQLLGDIASDPIPRFRPIWPAGEMRQLQKQPPHDDDWVRYCDHRASVAAKGGAS